MDLRWRGNTIGFGLALLALATMLGCQGMAPGKTSKGTGGAPGSLTVSAASLSFGSVKVGSNHSLPETLTNSGGSTVAISQVSVSGSGFSVSGLSLPKTLAAGQSVTFNVTFSPQSSASSAGTIVVASDASNSSLNVGLSGTGVAPGSLTANPSSLSFGNVQVGGSQTKTDTLTNSGGSSITISQVSVSGSGFSVSGLNLPQTLAAGQSVTFNVSFATASAGGASGSIAVVSDASNASLNVTLSGTGVTPGSLTANPSSLSFGSVQVGSSQTKSETLTNSGASSVTISQVSVSGSGFTVSGLTPQTLVAGQSVTFSVNFAPPSAGGVSGAIVVTSTASNSSLNVSLSGTGVTPGSLTANPSSLSFGSVLLGNSQTKSETLTNSGGSSVTISQVLVSGSGFSVNGLNLPQTLAAGQSVTFSVSFAPSTAGNANASIAVTSNASNSSLNVSLSGSGVTPGSLTANPSSLSFGNIQVGNSQTKSETLTNSGGSSVVISQVTISSPIFSVSALNLPLTLAPSQSVTFNVSFAPTSAGNASGSIVVVSSASNPNLGVGLSGTGTSPGQLTVSPSVINFGNVVVGAGATQNAALTANGAGVTISVANSSNAEFTVSGLSFPVMLAAAQSASFTVTFTPQMNGAASGSLSLVSNAANSPANQTMTGVGTPAPQHRVTLSWEASTSEVAGYNVYRGSQSGGPYTKLTSSVDAGTTYTDHDVQAGDTYYYVVTAIDSTGSESNFSNQTQAVIPIP